MDAPYVKEILPSGPGGAPDRFVVPADGRENPRLIVSHAILDAFNGLEIACSETSAKRRREMKSMRKLLAS